MAKVLGQRKRGRNKEQLRLTVTEIATTLKPGKGTNEVTVEVNPATTPKGKPEVVTFEISKAAAVVPVALTRPKNDANAREQIRLGLKDANVDASISSIQVEDDNGEQFAIFYVTHK